MREFSSFAAFAEHLLKREIATAVALHEGLEAVAKKVEKTAKAKIGAYQPEVGQFPAWEPLAEATIADRIAKGFTPDEPLLRTGDLRESIQHEVEGLEAVVGSLSEIAAWQELGTVHIPPRPFIGPAAAENEAFIVETIGTVAVIGLGGDKTLYAAVFADLESESDLEALRREHGV